MLMNKNNFMMRSGRLFAQFAILFSGLYMAAPANAFFYWQCGGDPTRWKNDATMRINRHNISATSSTNADVTNAMTIWTNTPGAWFDFNASTANSSSTSTSDGQNRIEYHFPSHVGLAHAHQRYDTCITWWPGQNQDIEETDVHLVADWLVPGFSWQHGAPDPRSAAGTNLRAATVHELGHSLGLSPTNATHQNGLLDNMNASVPAGGYTGGSASIRNNTLPDAARGFRFIYPGSANAVDMFVTNFRLVPGSTSASLVPALPSCMRPGQVFTLFFTVGNRGNQNSPNNACGVYMSTNDFISTSDTRIAGCSWGPGAHALVEMDSINVQVPWSTPTGTTRWFGLHLDDGNAVSESLESNNKVAAPGSPNSTDGVRIQASCP